jgi:site-specific recombinase XerD
MPAEDFYFFALRLKLALKDPHMQLRMPKAQGRFLPAALTW